ncbi:MAG: type II secretion system protein GspH [Nitrospinota bacterium]|nr:MAG: type II secretion system protein GspH [Nitrospinota bacterium]
MNPSCRESAFTTNELLVVLIIVGLLAVFTTPSLSRWLSHFNLNSAARDIASELQLARLKAIAQNTPFRISFDTQNKSYQVEREVSPGTWERVGTANTLPLRVHFRQVTAAPVFHPNGTATGRTAITLQDAQGTHTISIIVSPTGYIRIE